MSKKHDSDSPFASLAEFGQSLKTELDKKAEAEKARRAAEKKRALKADPAGGFSGVEAELMRHARSQGAALGKGKSADPDAVDLRKMEEKAKLNKAKASASEVSSSVDSGTYPTVRASAKPPVAEVGRTVGPVKPKVPPAPASHARNKKNQAEMLGVRAPGWADEFGGKASNAAAKGRVTAVLGPTNTGKTYMAIERMVAHSSGIIGLPLRLLAREVYGKLVDKVGKDLVALHTGEERIVPDGARYHVCTVEAMPAEADVAFVAIDEVQLASDFERGHVFTDRLLHLRGREETLLLGAETMKPMIEMLLPHATIISRPRLSQLSYIGQKKLSRLPRRSAVVTFSVNDVYAIAELVRRQRGGAAVVMGSLSPRTRNAQVELFQNGDVEHLIATDAIGMGLNLDLDHIAFAAEKKFDGFQHRRLTAPELAQIAGRAGRHTRDGTFGVTGRVAPFEDDLVEQLEMHVFQPIKMLQWRNRLLDFSSYSDLIASLEVAPGRPGLTRSLPASDVQALELLYKNKDIRKRVHEADQLKLLWDVCQVPDYRKIAPTNHAELIGMLFQQLEERGTLSQEWLAAQISYADRIDGDIDTLANRIAHIRTWTFVANKKGWLDDPVLWQEKTRAVEDRLSDALHERLTKRFLDRRTSVLMKRLREKAMLEAEITPAGDVLVEGQHVGQLHGFRFAPDVSAEGNDAKAIHAAAQKVLSVEFENRSEKIAGAANDQFLLSGDGMLRWQGAPIARLVAGDTVLKPRLTILADEGLSGVALENVQSRINLWLNNHITLLLQPLVELSSTEELDGIAKGLAFQLVENLGILDRRSVAEDVRSLDQDARASLRKFGVRFGAYHIYIPALLKPAPSTLLVMMWALHNGGIDQEGVVEVPSLSASGRTSIPVNEAVSPALYKTVGFGVYGKRAVRIDILERLADLIRPLLSWRPTEETPEPPEGVMDRGFTVTVAMTSLLGCAGEDFSTILKSLGYRVERRKIEPNPAEADAAKDDSNGDEAPEKTADIAPVEAEAPAEAAAEASSPQDSMPASESAAEAETAPSEAAAEVAEEEEQWLEIWRPGGRGDRRPNRSGQRQKSGARANGRDGQKDGQKDFRKGGKRSGPRSEGGFKGGNRSGGGEKGRGKPRDQSSRKPEKVADPDSPFAALAALKANLDNKK
ncbi:helicase-related protein [uncultured Cohaesibacter sp.]|uniref:helicase-related protein n=1 Tax=uncultured Cohaesibacter sp. TaxID=1002546 RepID=UPI003748EC58